jgi:hypothetical protein
MFADFEDRQKDRQSEALTFNTLQAISKEIFLFISLLHRISA